MKVAPPCHWRDGIGSLLRQKCMDRQSARLKRILFLFEAETATMLPRCRISEAESRSALLALPNSPPPIFTRSISEITTFSSEERPQHHTRPSDRADHPEYQTVQKTGYQTRKPNLSTTERRHAAALPDNVIPYNPSTDKDTASPRRQSIELTCNG